LLWILLHDSSLHSFDVGVGLVPVLAQKLAELLGAYSIDDNVDVAAWKLQQLPSLPSERWLSSFVQAH